MLLAWLAWALACSSSASVHGVRERASEGCHRRNGGLQDAQAAELARVERRDGAVGGTGGPDGVIDPLVPRHVMERVLLGSPEDLGHVPWQARDARCDDDSPPGYYLRRGWGPGVDKWVMHFEVGPKHAPCASLYGGVSRTAALEPTFSSFNAAFGAYVRQHGWTRGAHASG
jgi:hypothetical protein